MVTDPGRRAQLAALELDGHNVLLAPDGKKALEIVNTTEIDLIIADLKMPQVSGQSCGHAAFTTWATRPLLVVDHVRPPGGSRGCRSTTSRRSSSTRTMILSITGRPWNVQIP